MRLEISSTSLLFVSMLWRAHQFYAEYMNIYVTCFGLIITQHKLSKSAISCLGLSPPYCHHEIVLQVYLTLIQTCYYPENQRLSLVLMSRALQGVWFLIFLHPRAYCYPILNLKMEKYYIYILTWRMPRLSNSSYAWLNHFCMRKSREENTRP